MSTKYEVDLPSVGHGWAFRARRVQLGKNLADLAAESGIGINTLRRLEMGQEVELSSLRRVAPHLELSEPQAIAMLSLQQQFVEKRGGRPLRTCIREVHQ